MTHETAALVDTVISLRNGRSTVEVLPACGGSIASYFTLFDGHPHHWLRPVGEAARTTSSAEGMACFPLVPYSNRVRDGRFRFGQQLVQLPSAVAVDPHFEHGHGWRMPWQVESATATTVDLRYEHWPDAWPWAYCARQRIVLSESFLLVTLSIENQSDEPMPCGMGLHPYFPRTPCTRVHADVNGIWNTDADILPISHTPCPAASDPATWILVDQVVLDNVFTGWNGIARITWPERDASLVLEADRPLDCLVIYTPQDEPYFCAEPVSNITDAFNLASAGRGDTGLIVLEPGQTSIAQVRFTPHLKSSN